MVLALEAGGFICKSEAWVVPRATLYDLLSSILLRAHPRERN